MSEQQEKKRESANHKKPVIVDDEYLADIAKRLRMLRSLAREEGSRFS